MKKRFSLLPSLPPSPLSPSPPLSPSLLPHKCEGVVRVGENMRVEGLSVKSQECMEHTPNWPLPSSFPSCKFFLSISHLSSNMDDSEGWLGTSWSGGLRRRVTKPAHRGGGGRRENGYSHSKRWEDNYVSTIHHTIAMHARQSGFCVAQVHIQMQPLKYEHTHAYTTQYYTVCTLLTTVAAQNTHLLHLTCGT